MRERVVQYMALFVSLVGVVVVLAWRYDVEWIKTVRAGWVTMKITTAMGFVFGGIALYCTAWLKKDQQTDVPQVLLPIASLVIALLMLTQLVSFITRTPIGIEDLFIREVAITGTFTPGKPSPFTMTSFLVVAFAALYSSMTSKTPPWFVGAYLGVIGALPLLGYVFSAPYLYYKFPVPNYNTAMAFHTALCFLLLGVGYWALGAKRRVAA